MKKIIDIAASLFGLIITSPFLLPVIFLIWRQDFKSPFYIPNRVGKDGKLFRMLKLRSMVANADKSGVSSTSVQDSRITPIGRVVRKYKLDELSQLYNVLVGDMSLVGPRPNVEKDVALYTAEERQLLSVRPGITDISSIVFSDEGEILKDSKDPDLDYNRLIRPWKSRLGLLYIRNQSVLLDLKLIVLTVIAIVSKKTALKGIQSILKSIGADELIIKVSARTEPLFEYPPPGGESVAGNEEVVHRSVNE